MRGRRREGLLLGWQLVMAARAGVPLGEILRQQVGWRPGEGLSLLRSRLAAGDSLASALAAHPLRLAPWEAGWLRQGLARGEGAEILERLLAEKWEQEARRSGTKSALAYPAVILTLALAAFLVVGSALLPRLAAILTAFSPGLDLPLSARLLLGLAGRWPALLLVLGAVLALVWGLGLGLWGTCGDRLLLSLPGWGLQVRWQERARLLASLGRVAEAPGLTSQTQGEVRGAVRNRAWRRQVAKALEQVVEGIPLGVSLAQAKVLPPDLALHLTAAQNCGQLGAACRELSAYCARQHQALHRELLAWLEPGLILLAGGLVAVVALSLVQPLYLTIACLR